LLLACGLMAGCREAVPPRPAESRGDEVRVERNSERQETTYTIAMGDCRISWTVYESEANRGVIRSRSDCGLSLGEQAPLIAKLLKKAPPFQTLSWGRLYPDGARDATMASRLALAAKNSAEWDAARGAPRGGDVNSWVRKVANDAEIYRELAPVFRDAGLAIRLESVEKVLVLRADKLPFFPKLAEGGAQPADRLPFDCQAWFSLREAEH
jgi:hypothetical protein